MSKMPTDMRPMATMQHIGKRRWAARFASEMIPRLLGLTLPTLLLSGLACTMVTCFLFGLLFHACGSDCFVLQPPGTEFTLMEMVWLSVHTFTTIGFGSAYPTCHVGQLLILLEYYASLVLSSLVVAVFLFKFLKPHPLVRFSTDCLVIENSRIDGELPNNGSFTKHRRLSHITGKHLTLRIARESYYPLTDCKVVMSCVLRKRHGKGGNVVNVQLRMSEIHRLEVWDIWHAIDETSPLFENLDLVKQLYVQLTVRDTVYNQEVHLSHEYGPSSLKENKKFVEMISAPDRANHCMVDHSKMDLLEDTFAMCGVTGADVEACASGVGAAVGVDESNHGNGTRRNSIIRDGLIFVPGLLHEPAAAAQAPQAHPAAASSTAVLLQALEARASTVDKALSRGMHHSEYHEPVQV